MATPNILGEIAISEANNIIHISDLMMNLILVIKPIALNKLIGNIINIPVKVLVKNGSKELIFGAV